MSGLPTTYTVAQVAAAYQLTEAAIYRLVKRGVVNPMRLSTKPKAPMRFTDKDLDDLEKALRPAALEIPAPQRRRRRRTAGAT